MLALLASVPKGAVVSSWVTDDTHPEAALSAALPTEMARSKTAACSERRRRNE